MQAIWMLVGLAILALPVVILILALQMQQRQREMAGELERLGRQLREFQEDLKKRLDSAIPGAAREPSLSPGTTPAAGTPIPLLSASETVHAMPVAAPDMPIGLVVIPPPLPATSRDPLVAGATAPTAPGLPLVRPPPPFVTWTPETSLDDLFAVEAADAAPAAEEALPGDRRPAGDAAPGLASVLEEAPSGRDEAAPPAAAAKPAAPGPVAAAVERFEAAAQLALRKAWSWLIVGEEFRDPRRSLEYAVATTWGVRLAIALIVTGIAFGLRMSFEAGLIGPDGRIALGILAGIGMIAGGLLLLGKRYHILGQGLIGGGLATLYVTLFAAHHVYGRVDVWTAFALMAGVTVAAGIIAVSVSSLLIAVLGIIGGYLTPFVLKGSSAGYEAFFGYLLVLGIGILIIGHFRYWILLNYLGMAFTTIHVFRTLDTSYQPEHLFRVLPFLAALFLLYTAVTVIYNVANRRRCSLIEVLGLVANSGIFFWIAQDLIRRSYGKEQVAILTVALAVLYVGLIYAFLQRRLQDRALLLALLALAGFYLALTMPLLLAHEWLTVSWAVQAFLMLWLSRRLGSRFLQSLATVLYAIVVWRVFFLDLRTAFPRLSGELPLGTYLRGLADRLVAFGVPIAALVGAWRLHAAAPPDAESAAVPREADSGALLHDSAGLALFLGLAVLAGFVYLNFELNRLFGVVFEPFRLPVLTLLWLGLACGLLLAARGVRPAAGWLTFAAWAALLVVLMKLLAVDLQSWDFRLERMCFGDGGSYFWLESAMRLVDFGAFVLFAAWAAVRLSRDGRSEAAAMAVLALTVLFLYLTIEVNTLVRYYVPGLRSGGSSVLWSLYGLVLVLEGIRRAVRSARIAGLLLFAVVGLKVFFIDLGHLSALYRMVALIVMGVITLFGTFIYLRNAERFLPSGREEAPR
jgi:uncharacterized membrane protein